MFNGQNEACNTIDAYGDSPKMVGYDGTMKGRIDRAVAEAERRLSDAKRAQEILANNKELEELLNIMNRTHF